MRFLRPLIISFFVATAGIPSVPAAQETSQETGNDTGATITLNPLTVEGFVSGKRFVFDQAFAQKHNVPVPAPFQFIAPTSDDHKIFVLPAPGGTGIFKVTFTTLEKQVKSNLQFVPLTVDEGEIEDRLKSLQKLLKQAFIASVPDPKRAEINVTRATKIGRYPALEAIGRYDGGDDGVVVLRVVAIPDPDSVNGLVAIINGLIKNTGMKSVGDILNTDASRALGTFQFK